MSRFMIKPQASKSTVICINAKAIILNYDAFAVQLFGYKPDDLVGRDLAVLLPPELVIANPAKPVEVAVKHQNGDNILCLLTVTPFDFAGQQHFNCHFQCEDLESQGVDPATNYSGLLDAVLENVNVGVLIEGHSHEIDFINETYCTMFQKKALPLFLVGENAAKEIKEGQALFVDAQQYLDFHVECLRNQKIAQGYTLEKKDGGRYSLSYIPLMQEQKLGEMLCSHMWVYSDITEQKCIEKIHELQSEELQLLARQERALGHLMQLGLDATEKNQYFSDVLKLLLEEVPWIDSTASGEIFLLGLEDGAVLERLVSSNAVHNKQSLNGVIVLADYPHWPEVSAGTIIYVDTLSPQYLIPLVQKGEAIGVVVINLQADYSKSLLHHDFLTQVVDTVAIGIDRRESTVQLIRAKDEAESATEMKTQFLANMSHEIRTPMNGVLGMLHLLDQTELNAQQRKLIQTAKGSGEILLSVVNDILDFSKIEAGELCLESIEYDFIALLQEVTMMQNVNAHSKGLELLYLVEPGTPQWVEGDPTRLRQVLTNLLSNAIKFTREGYVMLYASQVAENLCIGVVDTGIGMNDAQTAGVFLPFMQADATTTRVYGGTGLGLAISRNILQLMGSDLALASEPNFGTDFSFTIPYKAVHNKKSVEFNKRLTDQHYLLVDDVPASLIVMKKILLGWQIPESHIELSASVFEAHQMLKKAADRGCSFDVVLIDQKMPEVEGIELAKVVRANKKLTKAYLVLLEQCEGKTQYSAVDACISKPINQAELYQILLGSIGEADQSLKVKITKGDTESVWFAGSRLLLVEDNKINQMVATEILLSAGVKVDICNNGQEAIDAVQKNNYDLVLMDIQMPIMDGFESTRAIRQLGGGYQVLPIVAMTAHALSGDDEKSFDAGMNAHVTKPINVKKLWKTLGVWLKPKALSKVDQFAKKNRKKLAKLPELPGINVAAGLGRLQDNWSVYQSILQGYQKKYSDVSAVMFDLINREDWSAAASLAHGLKGSSGNISAEKVFEIASKLEAACRGRDAALANGFITGLEQALNQVITGITNMLASEREAVIKLEKTAQPEPRDINSDEVIKLLEKLRVCIDSDLGEAQEHLAALKDDLTTEPSRKILDDITSAVNNFDLDEAKETMGKLVVELQGGHHG